MLRSRILVIHVFIPDGHEIYLVILVIYVFIANLSESQEKNWPRVHYQNLMIYERHNYSAAGEKKLAF